MVTPGPAQGSSSLGSLGVTPQLSLWQQVLYKHPLDQPEGTNVLSAYRKELFFFVFSLNLKSVSIPDPVIATVLAVSTDMSRKLRTHPPQFILQLYEYQRGCWVCRESLGKG